MASDLVFRSNLLSQIITPSTRLGRATTKEIQHMAIISTAAAEALDLQSEVSEYAMFKAMTTMRSAALVQSIVAASRLSPEVQAAQRHLTVGYLSSISRTTQLANDRIIDTLSAISSRSEHEGLLDRILDLFR